MSAFNAQVNVVKTDVLVSEEGQPPALQVALTVGLVVPVATSQGLQPAITALGIIRFDLNEREEALALAESIREGAELLPAAKSDILVASNLGDVERAAQQMSGLVAA